MDGSAGVNHQSVAAQPPLCVKLSVANDTRMIANKFGFAHGCYDGDDGTEGGLDDKPY
jgi:hypothetical protein